jgi:hypothetical protein
MKFKEQSSGSIAFLISQEDVENCKTKILEKLKNKSDKDLETGFISKNEYDEISRLIRLKDFERLKLNSLTFSTDSDSMVIGSLGEFAFGEYLTHLNMPFEYKDKLDHDYIINNTKIEIKTKKQTVPNDPISKKFESSINNYSKNYQLNDNDFYVFCRIYYNNISKNIEYGWLISYMKKIDYYKKSVFWEEGEKDPSNGLVFKKDAWNLEYSEMNKMIGFKREFII